MVFDYMSAKGANVGEGGLLGFLEIAQHGRGGHDGRIVIGEAEPARGARLPLFGELFLGVMRGELPPRPRGDGVDAERLDAIGDLVRLTGGVFGHQYFRRREARDLVEYLAIVSAHRHAGAGG
jgi:hypothetical protein